MTVVADNPQRWKRSSYALTKLTWPFSQIQGLSLTGTYIGLFPRLECYKSITWVWKPIWILRQDFQTCYNAYLLVKPTSISSVETQILIRFSIYELYAYLCQRALHFSSFLLVEGDKTEYMLLVVLGSYIFILMLDFYHAQWTLLSAGIC